MNSDQTDVAEFHRAMGQQILPKPSIPSREVIILRARLVTEEFGEFIGALAGAARRVTDRFVSLHHGLVHAYLHLKTGSQTCRLLPTRSKT